MRSLQGEEASLKSAKQILVVEDEPQMRRFLLMLLETGGYRTLESSTAREAISLCATNNPDLILLDLGLPDADGLDVIQQLREWSKTPIIVISAREKEGDKIEALDRGADDYVVKPFGAKELLARIRVALRHAHERDVGQQESQFTNGPLRIDYERRLAFLNDSEVTLTATEFRLLVFLAHNAGKVLTHRQILREVWGPNYVDHAHYVRIFMSQLRGKFEENPAKPRILTTETGVGYRMRILADAE